MNIHTDKKIMITGGHMTPALAVIDELATRDMRNIVWIGHMYSQMDSSNLSAEYKVVTSRNIKFIELMTGKLYRVWNKRTFKYALKALLNIPRGFLTSFKIIRSENPDIVVSFGGYLALPIVVAAKLSKIPVLTHEQTMTVGLANKVISKFTDAIMVSWKNSEKNFDKKKIIFTGNPIRQCVFQVKSQLLNFYNELPIIYVTGGNQGSNIINETMMKLIPTLLNEFNIVHQLGSNSSTQDYEKAIALRANLPEDLAERYIPKEYVGEDEIGEVLVKSALIISRCGANYITEFTALNKYCILIPIPNTSQNEQEKNARFMEDIGLAKVIYQQNLTSEILNKTIYEILESARENKNLKGDDIENTKILTRTYIKFDAASRISDEIEKRLTI